MREMLRSLCMSAVFIALLLSMTPEGGTKRTAKLCAGAVLCLILLGGLSKMDFNSYSLSIAKYEAMAESMSTQAENASEQMNRLVIEERCEAYIMDKAALLDLELKDAEVLAVWSREGVWLPQSVRLGISYSRELSEAISAELGIAPEKQEWEDDEAERSSP